MKCPECGKDLKENDVNCSRCGADVKSLTPHRHYTDYGYELDGSGALSFEQRYSKLLELVKDRKKEVMKFAKFLEEKTNWLTAPASTRFHLNVEKGLLMHSVNVTETLLRMRETLYRDISVESCVITALFHDTGKAGYENVPYYIKNTNEWEIKNRGRTFTVNPECVHLDIASRSLFLVSSHVSLSPEEAQAVRYHDGQYIDENKSVAHKEVPLTRLLQYADNWAAGMLE